MTNEFDVLKRTIFELERAAKMKNLNQDLLEHLNGSIQWMLSYSEKYNIPLPKKAELLRMVEKSNFLVEQITQKADQSTNFDSEDSRRFLTEPSNRFCKL